MRCCSFRLIGSSHVTSVASDGLFVSLSYGWCLPERHGGVDVVGLSHLHHVGPLLLRQRQLQQLHPGRCLAGLAQLCCVWGGDG